MKTTSATGSNRPRQRAGFTLIELSIVVFIIAIMIAISVPAFVRSYNATLLNETARTFATTCQLARMQAVTQQRRAMLHIDLERQNFWVTQALKSVESGEEGEHTLKTFELSNRVRLMSAERTDGVEQSDKLVEMTFYPNGTCDPVTVTFGGMERAGVSVVVDPVTTQSTMFPVKL
jgi:type II secretion system protein H